MIFSISGQYLTHRKKQAAISVMGVALGVAFFIGISSMMQGMHEYFIDRLINTAPHIKIMDEFRASGRQPVDIAHPESWNMIHGLKPKAETRGIRNAEHMIDALRAVPDLRVSPQLKGEVFLKYGGKDVASAIIGVNPPEERLTSNIESDIKEGKLDNLLTNASGIIIGNVLADKLGVKMGGRVNAVSPAGIIRQMKVVGIFESGVTQIDQSTSYALLKKVQILQGKEDTINQINIRISDVDAAPEKAVAIERKYKYRTESWQETFSNIFELFVIQNSIMYSTVAAILIVAGFGIYNIISNAVNEKSRDIAILKSMGFSEGDVIRIFFLQGLIIGMTGMVLGWVLGAVLVEVLSSIRLDLSDQVPVKFKGFPMFRSIWLYAASGVMAIFSAALSAWIPARRAALLDPVDIIRGASG